LLFKGCQLEVCFFEPKEVRELHLEESIDKKAYEQRKQRDILNQTYQMANAPSNLNDIQGLINSFNFIMGMVGS
jgi:hypothetical protein